MNKQAEPVIISLTERIKLIQNFPCFSTFTPVQYVEMAKAMQEIHVAEDEIIVSENNLIDSIYFIVSGEAEVTRMIKNKKKMSSVPFAVLRMGEAIGLNDTGFYSTTGKRTATVTATTPMLLLRYDIKDLYSFLEKHHLEISMYSASMQMLRMRFIKQSLPFARLSHERLLWLAERVNVLQLSEGAIIFKQGDEGDKCYLIRSGQVEISHEDEQGVKKQLALLKPPVIFGEATLITHATRNATARTTEQTELFQLDHALLSELIESEDNVANMFMTLMVDRSRPIKNPHVSLHQRITADGQTITILKNPDNGSYFKIAPEGAFIWEKLNGKNTLQEITLDLAQAYNVFAPNVVTALISKLSKSGFVTEVEIGYEKKHQSRYARIMDTILSALDFRYAFGDADRWVTQTYNRYIHYFFTRPGQILLGVLITLGFVAFAMHTQHVLAFFGKNHANFLLLFMLAPISFLETFLHELGHAFAVKANGREVHYIGIGLYWLMPVAFTDTSDMWLATRKPRVLVNLAGIYVDILVAGIAAISLMWITNPYIQGMLWLFALYTYINGFRMLSPFNEMDGYYVLMDWVEKTNLKHAAVVWLIKDFPKSIKHPSLFRKHLPEICYWLACIVFLIAVTLLTLMIQNFVLTALGKEPTTPYITLILPFLTVVFSSLGVISEIKRQQED